MVLTDAQKVDIGTEPEPGIYLNVPESTYFGWPYISKSKISKFAISPAQFRASVDGVIEQARSDSMLLGSAVDALWLYGQETFDEWFACEPTNPPPKKNGQPYSDWLKSNPGKAWAEMEEMRGRSVLTKTLTTKARAMVAELNAHRGRDGHPSATEIRDAAEAQVSVVYDYPGIGLRVQTRPDLVDFDRLIYTDLKSAQDVRPLGFSKAISNFDYHWQGWLYIRGLALLTDTDPMDWLVRYIAVRNEPVHSVEVYELRPSALLQAQREVEQKLIDIRNCALDKSWPSTSGELRLIDLAPWRRR